MNEGRAVFSVVIPARNEQQTITRCLDAIAEQSSAVPREVIVVDNGSTDSTPNLAAAHPIGARLLHERARGPFAARNAGIAIARGEVFAFTDADCEPEPDWLRFGHEAIQAGADLVGGAIIQRPSTHPTVWERYDSAVYLQQEQFVREQRFAATGNLFVRKEVFERIGPFCSEFVESGDVEFGLRASSAGYRLEYSSFSRVLHPPNTTLRDTWALHRRLGFGFSELARKGLRGPAWKDPALRIPLGVVAHWVRADGPPLRQRHLAHVHLVAMGARWVGRLAQSPAGGPRLRLPARKPRLDHSV
jgi:glycosyltransferase involved in cell wall biosynthesis